MSDSPKKNESLVRYVDVEEALRDAVKEYGVERLASQLGMSAKRLYAKLDPRDFAHPLHMFEARTWRSMIGSDLPVRAWAHEAGGVFVPLPEAAHLGDGEVFENFARMMSEMGDFAREFHEDMKDGRITGRELAKLEKEFNDLVAAGHELIGRLRKKAGR